VTLTADTGARSILPKARQVAHFAAVFGGTLGIVPVDHPAQVATIRSGPADDAAGHAPPVERPDRFNFFKGRHPVKPPSAKAMRLFGALAAGVLTSLVVCPPVLATLGEDVATVENDRVQMKAQLRTTSVAGYTVHEIQTSNGVKVREYVAPSGKVFAVAWNGPVLPDFRQTFGSYFNEYHADASSPRVGRRHLVVEHADLVVHSNGHMRAFYGNAYVPSLLPPNFSATDIK
jgi:hypothetical protein